MYIVIVVQTNPKLFGVVVKIIVVIFLCFDGIEYVRVTDHAHAPNPEEIISMELKSIINTGVTISHDPPRRIIHEALLYINKNDGTALSNYPSTQRTIERKRKQQDKPLPTPTLLKGPPFLTKKNFFSISRFLCL